MIQIDSWAYFFAALLILTLPLDWVLSAVVAAAFHELCHIAALYLLGGRISIIRIGVSGSVIETDIPGKGRELICTLAGPIGSMLLLSVCHVFPKLAVCGFLQAIFNLIPVYPLDGGRILSCCLELISPSYSDKILCIVEKITYLIILILSLFATMRFSLGILPVFAAGMLILKAILRKRPCKRR